MAMLLPSALRWDRKQTHQPAEGNCAPSPRGLRERPPGQSWLSWGLKSKVSEPVRKKQREHVPTGARKKFCGAGAQRLRGLQCSQFLTGQDSLQVVLSEGKSLGPVMSRDSGATPCLGAGF